MYNYVYKTTNTINGKMYIGKHSSKSLDDGYLGSGFLLSKAIKKYGRENFIKEILKIFETPEEAYDYEKELIDDSIIGSDEYYNLKHGGHGGNSGYIYSEESKLKMSKSAYNRLERDGFSKQIESMHKKESIQKMIETTSRNIKSGKILHSRVGKKHSEESKLRMKASSRKRTDIYDPPESFTKSTKGSKWYNNGIINKRIRIDDVIPDGFVKGRLK